jgi:hypothetical protein
MSYEQDVIIETYKAIKEQSSNKIRVRPITGQGLSTDAKVSCNETIRYNNPLGTKFRARAKITDRQGGTQFLYTNPHGKYTVVSDEEAELFIKNEYNKT